MRKFILLISLCFCFNLHSEIFNEQFDFEEKFVFHEETSVTETEDIFTLVNHSVDKIYKEHFYHHYTVALIEINFKLSHNNIDGARAALVKRAQRFANTIIVFLYGTAMDVGDKNLFWDISGQIIYEALSKFCEQFENIIQLPTSYLEEIEQYILDEINIEKSSFLDS